MEDSLIKEILNFRADLTDYEEVPELITDFCKSIKGTFKFEPKSIRMFLNTKDLKNFAKNNQCDTCEKEMIYRKFYGIRNDKVYYYLSGTPSQQYSKYKSIAVTTDVSINKLKENKSLNVILVTDKFILYTANNSKQCIRIGLADNWTSKDLKFMLDPIITNNFS